MYDVVQGLSVESWLAQSEWRRGSEVGSMSVPGGRQPLRARVAPRGPKTLGRCVRRAMVVAVCGTLLLLVVPVSAHADKTIYVPCNDSNPVAGGMKLVAAVTEANATTGPTTISLAAACHYSFDKAADTAARRALPTIRRNVTIEGWDSTLEALAHSSVLDMFGILAVSSTGTLKLDRVTLVGGQGGKVGAGNEGDSLYNGGGKVTITSSTIKGDPSYGDVGLSNDKPGTITLDRTTLTAMSGTAAVDNNKGARLIVRSSTFTKNIRALINSAKGTVEIKDSHLDNNGKGASRIADFGAGIVNFGNLIVDNSTINNNTAKFATGITNGDGGDVTLKNSHVNNNTALNLGTVGGILNRTAISKVTLVNTTVTGNKPTNCKNVNGC